MNSLASLLFDKGDLAAAESLYRRALEARQRVLGPEHPGYAYECEEPSRADRQEGVTGDEERRGRPATLAESVPRTERTWRRVLARQREGHGLTSAWTRRRTRHLLGAPDLHDELPLTN